MSEVVNRMDDPIIPPRIEDVVLADPEVLECPYPSYNLLLEQAPVWYDREMDMYVVTRYDDLRAILLDTETYSNVRRENEHESKTGIARLVHEKYVNEGWVTCPSLAGRDDPEHKQMRAIFDKAFRAGKVRELEPLVESLSYSLIDKFINDGSCEYVSQFAVPLPLTIICRQMGAADEDMWRIKKWTDAWIKGIGLGRSDEEYLWAAEMEIEAQHYFQPIFERLRKEPNDTLLSELVNTVIPEWGRPLSDNELHTEMMQDTFVGGSETTSNALAAGIMLLARNPDIWEKLKSNPDKYLKTFLEEVVRLESPVQGLTRTANRDVELHGVEIPKGATVGVRFAAANRDPRHFSCPERLDLERSNAGSHLGFSSGTHHCLGAPLARRELYWGFKAFLDRIESVKLAEGKNNLRHLPGYRIRTLIELYIDFIPAQQS